MGDDEAAPARVQASVQVDYTARGEPVNQRPSDSYKASAEFVTYEKLCRGEQTQVFVI